MHLEDRFTIRAPIEQVWAHLNDIPAVSSCIPGVEQVREVAPDVYHGLIKVKVGPIRASFQGEVKILERTPPSRLSARISGEDRSSASNVGATFSAELEPVAEGTHIVYRVDYTLRGRLGSFGSAVVQGTMKKMTAEFAACLEQALTTGV